MGMYYYLISTPFRPRVSEPISTPSLSFHHPPRCRSDVLPRPCLYYVHFLRHRPRERDRSLSIFASWYTGVIDGWYLARGRIEINIGAQKGPKLLRISCRRCHCSAPAALHGLLLTIRPPGMSGVLRRRASPFHNPNMLRPHAFLRTKKPLLGDSTLVGILDARYHQTVQSMYCSPLICVKYDEVDTS